MLVRKAGYIFSSPDYEIKIYKDTNRWRMEWRIAGGITSSRLAIINQSQPHGVFGNLRLGRIASHFNVHHCQLKAEIKKKKKKYKTKIQKINCRRIKKSISQIASYGHGHFHYLLLNELVQP